MDDREAVDDREPDRRVVLKRAALIGATTVWSTPLLVSLSGPALAATASGHPDEGAAVAGSRVAPAAAQPGDAGAAVLGARLPRSGSSAAQAAVAGAVLATGGAATVAASRRRAAAVAVAVDGPARDRPTVGSDPGCDRTSGDG